MINDWSSIRDRFLPHKRIAELQRQFDIYGRKVLPRHAKRHNDEMNDRELSLLIQGAQYYGNSNWREISKKLLPDWKPRHLEAIYRVRVQPLMASMQSNVISNGASFFNPCDTMMYVDWRSQQKSQHQDGLDEA